MYRLAEILRKQRKYQEAETMYRRCLEGRERVLGKENPYTLECSNELAGALYDKEEYEAAEGMY
jgi:hypothetical protein